MSSKGKPASVATSPASEKKDVKTPRERMQTVGVSRVNNVIHALEILENVADKTAYEYDAKEVAAIKVAITNATNKVFKRFEDALAGVSIKVVKEGFSL